MEKLSDVVIEQACAQHAHETNRAFVSAVDAGISIAPWHYLDAESIDRTRRMVLYVLREDGTAESKHEFWCASMREQGWSFGPGPDHKNMKHPLLVPWTDVPHTQQVKEVLVVASIRAMAMALGHSRMPMATATFGG
jgi:hypothetical protein